MTGIPKQPIPPTTELSPSDTPDVSDCESSPHNRMYVGGNRLLSLVYIFMSLLTMQFYSSVTLAQINEKPVLIGTVSRAYGVHPTSRGLREGLSELGYREFEDYVIGDFYTSGSNERLVSILDQMIENGSHILITMNEQATLAASKYRESVPVLFSSISDPIGMKLVQSFAKPGLGMTGIADVDHQLDTERLKRFRQLVPGLDRVLYAYQPDTETEQRMNNLRQSAAANNITLIEKPLAGQSEADEFFAQIKSDDFDGIICPNNASLGLMGLGIEAGLRTGIPTMGHSSQMVDSGAMASYGASYHIAGFQLARIVDKIIRGTNVDDIPVEVNRNFEFAINLGVARKIGLEIPPDLLYQADQVIR